MKCYEAEVVSTFRKLQSYTSVSNTVLHSFIQPLVTEHLLRAGDCVGLQGEAVEGHRQGPYTSLFTSRGCEVEES